jgi:hypothetical protein
MNPLAHVLFGALFASCLLAFGVELPRRRQGLGNSSLGIWRISLVIVLLAGVAAVPQGTRYFGDRKLDSGPIFNLFLFHDVLELTSQRFRLGNALLDPPVILFGLAFGVVMLFLAYLRSEKSEGWDTLLRDVTYFSVIIISLVAIRVVVSSNSYAYLPKTNVYINRQPHVVVEDSVFFGQVPIVGINREKALAVRDTYLTLNETNWLGQPPPEVDNFLRGSPYFALEYNAMVSMMAKLRQEPGLLSVEDLDRIIRSGALPETNMPLTLIVGIPLVTFAICTWLIYPGLETDEN